MSKPILYLPIAIWQQMSCYARAMSPCEVTGIGTIKANPNGDFEVTEIFLPQQYVDIATSRFAEGALNEIIFDLVKDNPARAGELRFRWHSHGEGQTFWSQIDEQDIAASDADWMVNLVLNEQQEALARLDVFRPLRLHNIELQIQHAYTCDSELYRKYAEEARSKCTFDHI